MAVKRPQILELNPPSEIPFDGPFNAVVTSYLELYNPASLRVVFKVKTTAPRRYCVRPNSGVIMPQKKVKIAIMLQPVETESERSKHKFMVQSYLIPEDHDDSRAENIWQDAKQDKIMDSKLRCVFRSSNQIFESQIEAHNFALNKSQSLPSTQEVPATIQQSSGDGKEDQAVSVKSTSDQEVNRISTTVQAAATAPSSTTTPRSSSKTLGTSFVQGSKIPEAEKSMASSHNLTTSFLQPMSDDYKLVLVSLAMLIFGVILGKYIIWSSQSNRLTNKWSWWIGIRYIKQEEEKLNEKGKRI